MRFLEKNKVLVGVVVVLLLCLVIAIGVRFFQKEEEKPNIPKDPVVLPEEDEWEVANTSSYSVEELWDLIQAKKTELRRLFYESKVYHISEIDSEHYNEEDDEKYVVFDSKFLEELNQIVSDELYTSFFNRMQRIKDSYYMAVQEDFSFVYFESAIAELRVDSSEVRLMSATDEFINASVTLNICESDGDSECNLVLQVPFELKRIGESWKVNKFQN